LVVELGTDRAKPCLVDYVGLPVFGTYEAFASQSLKYEKRAVRQDITFAGIAIDG